MPTYRLVASQVMNQVVPPLVCWFWPSVCTPYSPAAYVPFTAGEANCAAAGPGSASRHRTSSQPVPKLSFNSSLIRFIALSFAF